MCSAPAPDRSRSPQCKTGHGCAFARKGLSRVDPGRDRAGLSSPRLGEMGAVDALAALAAQLGGHVQAASLAAAPMPSQNSM